MKIERLMTLSQFVDKYHLQWASVRDYNEFLRQPLTKEMFVSEVQKPTDQYNTPQYYECQLQEWYEAEKKVIFKDIEMYSKDAYSIVMCIGDFGVSLFNDNRVLVRNLDTSKEYWVNTLHDLAEATKGELELKNFEI